MEFQGILRRMAVPIASICLIAGLGGCDFSPLDIPEDAAVQEGANSSPASSDSLTISNVVASSGRSYTVHHNLQVGVRRYMDRDFTFTAVPKAFVGQTYIRTANDDRNSYPFNTNLLSFDVNVDVDVYVADSDRTERPGWLKGWKDTGLDLRDDNNPETKYSVFTKRFQPGKITLGSNHWGDGANMYTVLIAPVAGPAREAAIESTPSGMIPAFPGAAGHGAMALSTCDRQNYELLRVTNLNDDGPGSFRDVIARAQQGILSIIVFDVGGYILLREPINLTSSCVYVAGQTAPGGGITIRAPDMKTLVFRNRVTDVVLRYFRVRNGTNDPGGDDGISTSVNGGENLLFDHLSYSWANNQLFAIYKTPDGGQDGPVQNITVQRTLFAEPFAKPTCYSIKGETTLTSDANGIPSWYEVEKVTFHHNAAIHCSYRAPMISAKDAEVINNVVYNWGQGAMSTNGRQTYVDFIGNYFKPGPMTRTDLTYGYEFSHDFRENRPGGAGGEPDPYVVIGDTRDVDGRPAFGLYLEGNVGPHNPTGALDNWSMTSKWKNNETYPEQNYESIVYPSIGLMPISVDGYSLRRSSPLPSPPLPVRVEDAFAAWQSMIDGGDVGANARLDCDGAWVDNADAVDQRVLREAIDGTGLRTSTRLMSENDVGGFPILASGTPCRDVDRDGMPDQFERLHNFDPNNPADARLDSNRNGYTNLEEYLNGQRPR